ncbi:MAG: leucine-rich repeat protein [Eubacterium sp.]|nr:leucine-rich repeat protein [Eubacterium sp.]
MKKSISFILSIVMLFSVIAGVNLTAYAETTEDGFEYSAWYGEASITGYSGNATDIVIPSKIKGCTVTEIGYYAFYDYENENLQNIKSVTIPEGVKRIGQGAFCSCSSLESIILPSTLTYIGLEAFYECVNLTSVDLTYVTELGDHAFSCSGLTSLHIPAALTNLSYPCYGCLDMTEITVDASNPNYTSIDGVLFSKDKSTLIQYPLGKAKSYKVPDETTTIKESAFKGSYDYDRSPILVNVDLNNVSTIESDAFDTCKSLERISATTALTSVDESAFYGCSNLKYVNYSGTKEQWGNIENESSKLKNATIFCSDGIINDKGVYFENDFSYSLNSDRTGAYVKAYTGESATLVIPETLGGVPVIGIKRESFKDNTAITSVEFPDSLVSIEDWSFEGCTNLTSIKIGAGLTDFDLWVFQNSNAISAITVSENNPVYDSRENCNAIIETETNTLIYGCGTTTIPESVTRIQYNAFRNCSVLTDITISGDVQEIDESAFRDCVNLDTISVDSANTKYDSRGNCNAVIETETNKLIVGTNTTVIPDSVTEIGDEAFYGRNITSIAVPASVTKIGEDAFGGCKELKDIYFGGTAQQWLSIVTYSSTQNDAIREAVIHCSDYNVNEGDFKYGVSENSYYGGVQKGELYIYEYTGNDANVTVPATIAGVPVASINQNTFSDNDTVENVVVSEGIKYINHHAFNNCSNLKTISLPKSLAYLAYNRDTDYNWDEGYWYYVYQGFVVNCPSLTEVFYNGTMQEAASISTPYSNIYLPNMVDTVIHCTDGDLNKGDFNYYVWNNEICILDYHGNSTDVVIPAEIDGMKVVELKYGFSFNKNTTSISIPDGISGVGYDIVSSTAFYKNDSNWENGVLYIDNYLIKAKPEISGSYNIKPSTKVICGSAFYDCTALTGITIPEGVTDISYAFQDCTSLKTVYLPKSINNLNSAFYDCDAMTDIYFSGTAKEWFAICPEQIGKAVVHCTDMDLFKPEEQFKYYYSSYSDCICITGYKGTKKAIEIPETINGISVKKVSICDNNSLKKITVPEGIDDVYIRDCSALECLYLPSTVKTISSYAFYGCDELKKVSYEGTAEDWEKISKNCSNLTENTAIHCTDEIINENDYVDYKDEEEQQGGQQGEQEKPTPAPTPTPAPAATTDTKTATTPKTTVTLKKVTVKKSAKKLVLQATVKVDGKAVKGKKVTFKFNGKKYTAKTNAKGVAKVTIKKAVLKKLKVGKKIKITATYKKVTAKRTVKVKK